MEMEGATREQRAAKVAGGMADQECFKDDTMTLYARLVTQLSRRCGSSGVGEMRAMVHTVSSCEERA